MNWNFYNSYPKFKKVITSRQNHVLKLYVHSEIGVSILNNFLFLYRISALLKDQKIHGNIRGRDADHQFELIEEGNDTILDRVVPITNYIQILLILLIYYYFCS